MWLNKRVRTPLLNPLLVAVTFIIIVLTFFHIPLSDYQAGAKVISYFLGPATAVLAYSIYRQIAVLKRHFIPILCGCLAGSVTSMLSSYGLCVLFGMDKAIALSTIPKSVTTPIAMSISQELGGVASITVAVVIASGIMGSILAPTLTRIFHVKRAPANVASEPKTTSSMPSMPVPESTMLATLAITQPSVRPGMAAGVKSARAHSASETRNWMGPHARLPKNSRAIRVQAA